MRRRRSGGEGRKMEGLAGRMRLEEIFHPSQRRIFLPLLLSRKCMQIPPPLFPVVKVVFVDFLLLAKQKAPFEVCEE